MRYKHERVEGLANGGTFFAGKIRTRGWGDNTEDGNARVSRNLVACHFLKNDQVTIELTISSYQVRTDGRRLHYFRIDFYIFAELCQKDGAVRDPLPPGSSPGRV